MPSRNPPEGKVKMTVNIDPDLKKRLKKAATDLDTPMQDIVVQVIDEWLRERGR